MFEIYPDVILQCLYIFSHTNMIYTLSAPKGDKPSSSSFQCVLVSEASFLMVSGCSLPPRVLLLLFLGHHMAGRDEMIQESSGFIHKTARVERIRYVSER